MTDPIHISANIRFSIFYGKITYVTTTNELWIGLLNWKDTHYPQGLLIILIFFCCYDLNNLFFIIKFFGSFINLISIIFIYFICQKITKNKYSGIIGMLAWINSSFINDFSTITIPSTFSLSLLFLVLFFIFDNDKTSKIISGIFLGTSFLIHPVFSSFFFLPCIIILFIIQYNEKKPTFSKFFFIAFLITLIPYILLFKYSNFQINNSIIDFLRYKLISLNFNNLITIDLKQDWLKDLMGQPTLTFYLLSLLSIFHLKRYRKHIIFFSLLYIISFLFIINPFIINRIPLKELFNKYYLNKRGLFMLTLSITFLSAIGFDKLDYLIKNLTKYLNINKISKFLKKLYLKILIILLLYSQTVITLNHLKFGYGFFWPHNVPEEYTEIMMWIGQNINKENEIIIPNNTWNVNYEIKITWYYQTFLLGYNIIRNNSFYPINHVFEYDELENMNFFKFDFIILPNNSLKSYKLVITDYLKLKFSSSSGEFYLFEIL
ncbi:MAG: hypothetical protein ACTSRP_21760 [Candidatus Helarchaeota archaeon]